MRFCVRIFVRFFVRFLMESFVRSSLGAALTPILTNLDRAKAWDQVSLARSAARSVFCSVFYSVGIRKCHAEQSDVSAKVLGLGRFGTLMGALFLNRSRTRKDTLPSAQRDTSYGRRFYGRRSYGQASPLILPTSWLVS